MNQTALTKLEIHRELALLPDTELQALKILLDRMVKPAKTSGDSLKGIWKNKGFEQLDIEAELRQARTEMHTAILKKAF
jgi:hypothetical protein